MYFNFEDLINKYSRDVTILSKTRNLNDVGDWEEEVTECIIQGAILGINENKIYKSEGALTIQDKALYTLTPIADALMNGKVVFNGNTYGIENQIGTDNAEFTGVYNYTLKFISAFNEGGDGDD